ncbi:hypothetical protein SCACP_32860 [Sporomusa carbonis]|uniref:retron system putative HNH endonuclease n=1 Tax=Sporomusa carbonis TaxID=3076075 RepID=UPI003A6D1B1F
MIFIEKGQEPESLIKYKQQKGAHYEGFPVKGDIMEALLLEQGYICAYCMRRISKNTMTIEHYIPQYVDENLALDYRNMVGVCLGNRGHKKKYMTCDAHRENVKLTINPLDRSKVRLIKYKSDGTIYSDDKEINKDLDVTLNLNCDAMGVFLKSNRKAALKALLSKLSRCKEQGQWTKTLLLKIKNSFKVEGKNAEYRGIMDYYIDKRLRRS